MQKKSKENPFLSEEFDKEGNGEEWQVISRILDRFLFMLNVIAMSITLVMVHYLVHALTFIQTLPLH